MWSLGKPWTARDPVDGGKVKIRRLTTGNQAEQVEFLRAMVTAYASTWNIIALARDIVFRQAGCPPKKKACHALAIGRWVQQNVTYVNEGEEQFQTPLQTLRLRYGDCDDFSTLIATLTQAIGIPSELVAVAWSTPGVLPFGRQVAGGWLRVFKTEQFRHIFPRALIPSAGGARRMPLDATLDQPVDMLTNPIAMAVRRGVQPRTLVL